MNRSLSEGIITLLSQSGLARIWWEDAAIYWLHGKIRLPSSVTAPLTHEPQQSPPLLKFLK